MNLRDKIALEALKVAMNNIADTEGMEDVGPDFEVSAKEADVYYDTIARGAYQMADAMMRVRGE